MSSPRYLALTNIRRRSQSLPAATEDKHRPPSTPNRARTIALPCPYRPFRCCIVIPSVDLGLAVDAAGKVVYIADTLNHRIRKIDIATGIITTLAGQGIVALGQDIDPRFSGAGGREGGSGAGFSGDGGPGVDALLAQPTDVALSLDGNLLYVADDGNDRIRVIDLATGVIDTVVDGGAVFGDARNVESNSTYLGGAERDVTFTNFDSLVKTRFEEVPAL